MGIDYNTDTDTESQQDMKYELDSDDDINDWEIDEEVDPSDNGEEWRQPYIDPWGRRRSHGVVDGGGDHWIIIDGNGMTYTEPKKTFVVYKRKQPVPQRSQSI